MVKKIELEYYKIKKPETDEILVMNVTGKIAATQEELAKLKKFLEDCMQSGKDCIVLPKDRYIITKRKDGVSR